MRKPRAECLADPPLHALFASRLAGARARRGGPRSDRHGNARRGRSERTACAEADRLGYLFGWSRLEEEPRPAFERERRNAGTLPDMRWRDPISGPSSTTTIESSISRRCGLFAARTGHLPSRRRRRSRASLVSRLVGRAPLRQRRAPHRLPGASRPLEERASPGPRGRSPVSPGTSRALSRARRCVLHRDAPRR